MTGTTSTSTAWLDKLTEEIDNPKRTVDKQTLDKINGVIFNKYCVTRF